MKNKCRRKNKEDVVLDAFFWPCMPGDQVAITKDENKQSSVSQPYEVPLPDSELYRRHDEAMYSIWMHFCDFCATLDDGGDPVAKRAQLEETAAKAQIIANKHPQDFHLYNVHTGRKRLSCFTNIKPATSHSISAPPPSETTVMHRPVSVRAGPPPSTVTPTHLSSEGGLMTWLLTTPPSGLVPFTNVHPSYDLFRHRNEIQQPICKIEHNFVPISDVPPPYALCTVNPFASEMALFGPPQFQQQHHQPVVGLFPPHAPAPSFVPGTDKIYQDDVSDDDRFGLSGAFSDVGFIDTMLQNLLIDELGESDHDASVIASPSKDDPATPFSLLSSSSATFPSALKFNCAQPHQPEQQPQEVATNISTGGEGSSKTTSLFPWLRAVQSKEQNFFPVTPERRERLEKDGEGVPSPVSVVASVREGVDSPYQNKSSSSQRPSSAPKLRFGPV